MQRGDIMHLFECSKNKNKQVNVVSLLKYLILIMFFAFFYNVNSSVEVRAANEIQELTSSGTHVAYYSSLSTAFSSATSGNTIKMLANVSECNVTLSSSKTINLDMNSKTLNCVATSTQTVKGITNNGTLTIRGAGNINVDQTFDSWTSSGSGNAYGIYNTGTLTLNSVRILTKASDSYDDGDDEYSSYVYGVYTTSTLNFLSGSITLDWGREYFGL